MVGGIAVEDGYEFVLAGEQHVGEHAAFGIFGHYVDPVFTAGPGEVDAHEAIARSIDGGEHVHLAVDHPYWSSGIVLAVGKARPLAGLVEALEGKSVAVALSRCGDPHGAFVVRHVGRVEIERLFGILEHHLVLAFGSAQLMVVYFVVFVCNGVFLAGFGARVSAVVEAVAVPCRAGELGPFDVVGQQLAGGCVEHVYLGPVAAGARYGVGGVAPVVALVYAGKGHRAVVGEFVGVDKYLRLGSDAVHAVENALVFRAVVGEEIIFAVVFQRGQSFFLIAVESRQAFAEVFAERNLREVVLCHLVFGLYPRKGCGCGVVFERTVGVGHCHAENFVAGAVGRCCRVFYFPGFCAGSHKDCHCKSCVDGFHIFDDLVITHSPGDRCTSSCGKGKWMFSDGSSASMRSFTL